MKHLTFATAVSALLASTTAFSDPSPTRIPDVLCLRKMALDLTNAGPSDEDLAALASGTPLSAFADKYIASPAFAHVAFNVARAAFSPTGKVPDMLAVAKDRGKLNLPGRSEF